LLGKAQKDALDEGNLDDYTALKIVQATTRKIHQFKKGWKGDNTFLLGARRAIYDKLVQLYRMYGSRIKAALALRGFDVTSFTSVAEWIQASSFSISKRSKVSMVTPLDRDNCSSEIGTGSILYSHQLWTHSSLTTRILRDLPARCRPCSIV